MKTHISYVIAALMLCALCMPPSVVYAQSTRRDQQTDQQTIRTVQTTEEAETSEPTDTLTEDDETVDTFTDTEQKRKNRKERLDAYKKKVRRTLADQEREKITGECKGAQKVAGVLAVKVDRAQSIRVNAVTRITTEIEKLSDKLRLAGFNTTQLDVALSDIDAQSITYLAAAEEYQTTIEDVAAMNCIDDPEAFVAALTAAREMRVDLVSSSQELRKFVKESLKPIVVTIRSEIRGDDSEAELPVDDGEPTDENQEPENIETENQSDSTPPAESTELPSQNNEEL